MCCALCFFSQTSLGAAAQKPGIDVVGMAKADVLARERFQTFTAQLPHARGAGELEMILTKTADELAAQASAAPMRFRFWISALSDQRAVYLGGGVFVLHAGLLRRFNDAKDLNAYLSETLARAIALDEAGVGASEPSTRLWRPRFERWFFCQNNEKAQEELDPYPVDVPGDAQQADRAKELQEKFAGILEKKQLLAIYPLLRNGILSDRYQVYGGLCGSADMRKADDLYARNRWMELLDFVRLKLRGDPTQELWRWLEASALAGAGRYGACVEVTGAPWALFDERREVLHNACLALKGDWTNALAAADATAARLPDDFQAQFWRVFFRARARAAIRGDLDGLERRWGDRPALHALKILYFGGLEKPKEAQDNVDFRYQADQYEPWEWGALSFANAWLKNSFAPEFGDERAQKLLDESARDWGLARAFWPHFARSR